MRSIPVLMALCVFATACDPTSSSEGGPTLTDHTISYWASGNAVQVYATASSPDGQVTIACHGPLNGTAIDTSAVDTLNILYYLGDRPRSAGVTASLDCAASTADATTPFTLTLNDPGVADAAPVFDTLLVQSYVQADSVNPKTIGVRYVAHDDFGLTHWKVERSDSSACPCTPFAEDDLNSQVWVGVMFLYLYNSPGTYYLKFTLTDDAGHTTSAWRGPLQVPLP